MKHLVLILATLSGAPATAQSLQTQQMRYRAEIARERSRQHAQQIREDAYWRQQAERQRQAELRARSHRR